MIEEAVDEVQEESEPLVTHQTTEEILPEISFHAIVGTNHPQTLRVIGKLGNKYLTILIDRGSTHNFIDQGSGYEVWITYCHKQEVLCYGSQ